MSKQQQNFCDLSSEENSNDIQHNSDDSVPEDDAPQQEEIINELQNDEQLNELYVDPDEPMRQVYLPSNQHQELQPSSAAYDLFQKFSLEWPCLSIDSIYIDDSQLQSSNSNGESIYLLGGTQPASNYKASVQLMRISNVKAKQTVQLQNEDVENADSELDDESSMSDVAEPLIERRALDVPGDVCRIRSFTTYLSNAALTIGNPRLAVCQLNTSAICFIDLEQQFKSLNAPQKGNLRGYGYIEEKYSIQFQDLNVKPAMQQFPQKDLGYGLAVNPVYGIAISGTRGGELLAYRLTTDGRILRDPKDFGKFPSGEWIEEVQFLRNEDKMAQGIFAAAGTNGWLQMVDPRQNEVSNAQKLVQSDINALDFDYFNGDFMYCGTEAGEVLLYDLRNMSRPVVQIQQNKSPITSLKASPTSEGTVIASDDSGKAFIYQMDADEDQSLQSVGLPDQYLFLHCGLEEPREVAWAGNKDGLAIIADAAGLQLFKPVGW